MKGELRIDEELRSLIPPLSEDEYKTLEDSILTDGIRDALAVWDDIIVDGHNRYEVAQKHGLSYKTLDMGFKTREDAMIWMIDNQRGRRNLTAGAWAELGLKRSALLEEQAKENQQSGLKRGDAEPVSLTLDKREPIDTLAEAAKYSGVSRATVAKAKKVYDSDNEELKQKVRTGETSINRAYQEIKKTAAKPAPDPVGEPDTDEPEVIAEYTIDEVDATPTEAEQKKEQGEKYALSIIRYAEKILDATETRTKSSAISALDQWVSKQKESL